MPIALGILAASGAIEGHRLADYEFAGELSLSGALRPIRGALAMALALHQSKVESKLVLPPESAQEAALVPGAHVYSAKHLLDVVRHFSPAPATVGEPGDAPSALAGDLVTPEPLEHDGWCRVLATPVVRKAPVADMADVKGQAGAKRALEIAAAGGHSVLLMGPPGSGKSMLAQRFAGLLPEMSTDEALQSAAIGSLSGRFSIESWGQRPTCAPHHSASAVALVGGGSPPRPGEISLAHHGVLFLDELPEYPRAALEALREPLETGTITIARAARRAEFPARFQLIAAMNPCPCGYQGSNIRACRCTPDQVHRYQSKLSGPLMDRIDLHIEVPALPAPELLGATVGESSASMQSRCTAARERAQARQGKPNHALAGQDIDTHCLLAPDASKFLQSAAAQLGWSARGTHRTLKIARTIADLAGSEATLLTHVAEAMQYRRALRASH